MSLASRSILVYNLKPDVDSSQLQTLLSSCGKVERIVSPAEGAFYVIYLNGESVQFALSGLNNQVFAGRQLRIRPVEQEREGQLISLVTEVLHSSLIETEDFLAAVEGDGTDIGLGEAVGGSVGEKLVSDSTSHVSKEFKLQATPTTQTNISSPYAPVDTTVSSSLATNTSVSMTGQAHLSQAMGQLNSLGASVTSHLYSPLSTSSTLVQFTLPTFSPPISYSFNIGNSVLSYPYQQPGIYSSPNYTSVPRMSNYLTMPLSTNSGPRFSTFASQPQLQAPYLGSSSTASAMVQHSGHLPLPTPYQRPTLSHFSGMKESASDVSFKQWQLEVEGLLSEGFADSQVINCMRRTLRGRAGDALLNLGSAVTVAEVVNKFQQLFGDVQKPEIFLEEFFSALQLSSESITSWSCRLESMLKKVSGLQDAQQMLRSKFWSGLKDYTLKNAIRYKFESGVAYEELLVSARSVEEELDKRNGTAKVEKKAASKGSSAADGDLAKQVQALASQVQQLAKKLEQTTVRKSGNSQQNKNASRTKPEGTAKTEDNKDKTDQTGGNKRVRCHKCREFGHYRKDCPN